MDKIQAIIKEDFQWRGVKIAIMSSENTVHLWPKLPTHEVLAEGTELPNDAWLHLNTESARALYEALAEHFGHTGHDIRTLRRDYEQERARVDKFINHFIK